MQQKKGSIITLGNGFGQIQIEDQLTTIFFHVSEVEGAFQNYKIGDTVEFTLEQGTMGYMARNIKHIQK